jgi:ferredoxin-NADP reductase
MHFRAKKLQLRFIEKREVAPDIYSFYFTPQEKFQFIAGQYLQLAIVHEPDELGTTRYFSIASSPSEEHIMITVRKGKSSFKNMLFTLKTGEIIEAFGPIGKFTLEDYNLTSG